MWCVWGSILVAECGHTHRGVLACMVLAVWFASNRHKLLPLQIHLAFLQEGKEMEDQRWKTEKGIRHGHNQIDTHVDTTTISQSVAYNTANRTTRQRREMTFQQKVKRLQNLF